MKIRCRCSTRRLQRKDLKTDSEQSNFHQKQELIMDKYTLLLTCCLFLFFSKPAVLTATSPPEKTETQYVSDFLVINIKDQIDKPYSVVKIVHSGDPLEILDEQDNYYKVRTIDGKTGWIAKQYAKKELPKILIIKKLREELEDLKNQQVNNIFSGVRPATDVEDQCKTRCIQIRKKLEAGKIEIRKLIQEKHELLNTLSSESSSTSINQIKNKNILLDTQLKQTASKYSILVGEFEKRGGKIAELQTVIAKQDNKTRFYWFVAGAIVFFAGLLAGKSGRRKKNKLIY